MFESSPAAFFLGLLVGSIITVVLIFPRIGRAIGKTAAVGLMGFGAGLLVWGFISIFQTEPFEPLAIGSLEFYNSPQILGWGGGALVSGIAALVLSLTASKK